MAKSNGQTTWHALCIELNAKANHLEVKNEKVGASMLVKAQNDAMVKEFLNWTMLIVVIGILSLLLARAADGARPLHSGNAVPGTLPPMMDASPMAPMSPAMETPKEAIPPAEDVFGSTIELWTVLELHRAGEMDDAIPGWKRLTLPCDMEVWRSVGLAAAYLRSGETDRAADVLEYGLRMDPNNAVLHYYNGITLLAQAVTAPEWYDAAPTPHSRFVSHRIPMTEGNSLFHLAAISEFEKAIELAKDLDLDQPLLPPVIFANAPLERIGTGITNGLFVALPNDEYFEPMYRTPKPLNPPTVGELLTAIGGDDFVGKAHNMLAPLYLERRSLERAEEHMDAAVASGMNVLDGYTELGDRYEARGQNGDAFRAHLKSLGRMDGIIGPARKAINSLRKALDDSR